jgi:hypothetical protein
MANVGMLGQAISFFCEPGLKPEERATIINFTSEINFTEEQ